ncbi:MAG: DNA polymerase II, partial [Desulfuromonadales bacterium]|nr:DNA polymerase II [Desulfuromonadales bacterium]
MQIRDNEHIPLLFGHDQRTGIVAVEPAGHFVRLFYRTDAGVHFHDEPFHPFILVNDPALLNGCKTPCSIRALEGDAAFCHQLLFDSWGECLTARDFLAHKTG